MRAEPAEAGVELRRATAGDVSEVAEVYLASFKATYDFPLAHTDEQVRRWVAEILLPTNEVWVAASDEGPIVGMMALSAEMLEQLYVAPALTGRGVGSRLIELAKHQRPSGLDLYTFQVNQNARRFYERRGFTEVERGDGSENEERQPDVRYAWRPTPTRSAMMSARVRRTGGVSSGQHRRPHRHGADGGRGPGRSRAAPRRVSSSRLGAPRGALGPG